MSAIGSPVINTNPQPDNGISAVASPPATSKGAVAAGATGATVAPAISASPSEELFGFAQRARPPAPAPAPIFPPAAVTSQSGKPLSNPTRPPFLATLAPQFPLMGNAATTSPAGYEEKPVYSAPAYRDYSSSALTTEQIGKWCEEGKEHNGYKNVWLKVSELTTAIQHSGMVGAIDAKVETAMLAGVFNVAMDLANNNLKTSTDIAQGFLDRLDGIAGQLRTRNVALRQDEKLFTASQPAQNGSIKPQVIQTSIKDKVALISRYYDENKGARNPKLWDLVQTTAFTTEAAVTIGLVSRDDGSAILDSVVWAADVLLGKKPSPYGDEKQTRTMLRDFLKFHETFYSSIMEPRYPSTYASSPDTSAP
jgi:hypothetical protein